MNNITLIGMPGCGKSTVGRLLAAHLGYSFWDLDHLIEQREQATLQQIIDSVGVEQFLQLEADAICSVCCQRHVLSPGGSAVCLPRAAEHLKKLGTVIYLRTDADTLERRVKNFSSRGIALSPGQSLSDLLALRAPLYQANAHHILDCPADQSPEQTVTRVISILEIPPSGSPEP